MRELFVYYRVRSGDVAVLQNAVFAMQSQLTARHPALRARLLRRPEETHAEQTWMESYATDPQLEPAGISAAVQAEIEAQAAALAPRVSGSRHTEVFIAFVASPAETAER